MAGLEYTVLYVYVMSAVVLFVHSSFSSSTFLYKELLDFASISVADCFVPATMCMEHSVTLQACSGC